MHLSTNEIFKLHCSEEYYMCFHNMCFISANTCNKKLYLFKIVFYINYFY